MAVDRSSAFVISFDAEAGSIDSVLSAIKTSFKSTVSDIEQTTRKVVLFEGMEQKVKASADALFDASAKAKILTVELDKLQAAGSKATPELVAGLKAANREVDVATTAYNKNVDALTKMQGVLSKAGVDTSNLARAQIALAESSRTAAAAAAEQAAKQLLNVKSMADIAPQIQKLNAAYALLRESGTLSVKELGVAHTNLQTKIKETNAELTALGAKSKESGNSFVSGFTQARVAILGALAAVGGLTAEVHKAIESAQEYQTRIAQIGTVTNLSAEQLGSMGEAARKLARDIGFDLNEGLKALYELIRSGISPDNALKVLEVSAEAAKAGMTDLTTSTKASQILLHSFGFDVKDLGGAFDVLNQSAKDGGVTIAQFTEGGGKLGVVAKAARIPFDELNAALTILTRSTRDGEASIAALTKLIAKMDTEPARVKLHALGIETGDFVKTLEQIGAKKLDLAQLLDLGLTDKKTAAAFAALTSGAKDLANEIAAVGKASGLTKEQLDKLAATPKEKIEKLTAAYRDMALTIGQNFVGNSVILTGLTKFINLFNDLPPSIKDADVTSLKFLATMVQSGAQMLQLAPAEQSVADGAREMARFMEQAGRVVVETTKNVDEARRTLGEAATALLADSKSLEAAATRDLADLKTRADAQIAALDKSAKAQATTAAATIAIQTKLASDQLAIIQKNEAAISAAVEAAAGARFRAATARGDDEKKIARELAQLRIDALAPVLAQYQTHYASLVALAQQHSAKINSIEQERIAFNEGVEKTLFDLRLGGLSALDQYAAKVKEIDRLIAAAREAGVNNDIAGAKKYTDQAIALSGTLKGVIDKDGVTIISSFDAQQKSIAKIKEAAEGYNTALDKSEKAAKDGLAATERGIAEVLPKLQELQKTYDELKKAVAEGLSLQISIDEGSLASARQTIDELTKPRTVVVTTVTNGGGGDGSAPAGANSGGFVGGAPQGFAGGGHVFRRPSWNKVPGSGNSDTVPALLERGSFVLRKAATQGYGDSLLMKLARGFAKGGPVNTISDKFPNVYKDYRDTIDKLSRLAEAAIGLPGPGINRSGSLTIREWASRLIEAMPTFSKSHDEQVKKLIDASFDGWMAGIGNSQKSQVPSLMDYSLYGILKQYSRGGDVVPAMLTPGEYVFRPEAVQAISRMFGGGMLPAMNAMRVPSSVIAGAANFAAPSRTVARFAEGGAVGSIAGGSTRGGAFGGAENHYHFHMDATDLLSEETIRRKLIPVLNDINRRSGRTTL